MLPSFKGELINPHGFPVAAPAPRISPRNGYSDVLYQLEDVVSDWPGYSAHLGASNPTFKPRVLLISHDMTEIENITLMALGGVVKALNGEPHYVLVNPGNCRAIDDAIERWQPEWIGFNFYTGLTDHAFEWLHEYKLSRARSVFKKNYTSFEEADRDLKNAVRENGSKPLRDGNKIVYTPVIIGGHYNNHDYMTSLQRGAEFSVRGKGVNLLKDILESRFAPGVYHDPVSFPNIPVFDREGFYRDTFDFSDKTKKYALSPIKSVLTALGCAYRCTYCYISSLIQNQDAAYQGTGIKPPSIIQDRPLEIVLREGLDIRRLDEAYGTRTRAVFDQADISLNNLEWWGRLQSAWTKNVGIPFYIQARPAMLSGKKGVERIRIIAKDRLVAGISMAIESGDPAVRRLLLKRMEDNPTILDALKNVKSFMIPVRTQAITGLPVIRPRRTPKSEIGLVDPSGVEHYYEDPLQETLKCLELVSSSGSFAPEDYYWNSLYSPFPGTPLGDYSFQSGFHDGATDNKERAYMFTSEVGLECFPPATTRKQVAFHRTANFFAHLLNGKDMATLFLYEFDSFDLQTFASFVAARKDLFATKRHYSKFGLIPEPTADMIIGFVEDAYPDPEDAWFKEINRDLCRYYELLLDGLVLAAKVADRFYSSKAAGERFNLDQLARVERNHYYDNSYHMAYLPARFAERLKPFVHENRDVQERDDRFLPGSPAAAIDEEISRSAE